MISTTINFYWGLFFKGKTKSCCGTSLKNNMSAHSKTKTTAKHIRKMLDSLDNILRISCFCLKVKNQSTSEPTGKVFDPIKLNREIKTKQWKTSKVCFTLLNLRQIFSKPKAPTENLNSDSSNKRKTANKSKFSRGSKPKRLLCVDTLLFVFDQFSCSLIER